MAWANMGTSDATMTLTAYDQSGNVIAGSNINNPAVITLPAGAQLPLVDTQIFGAGLSSQNSVGWIRAETDSPSDKIASFFMLFNRTATIMDGANVSSTGLSSFLLPEIEDQGFTQVSVANPQDAQVTMNIELLGSDGNTRSATTRYLNPNGSAALLLSDLFPEVAPSATDYVRVTADQNVVPLEILGKPSQDVDCLEGQDIAGGATTLYSPQYAVGGNWQTTLSVINLDPTSGTVRFRFVGDDGVQIGESKTLPIQAYGKIHITDPTYFAGTVPGLTQGYLEIVSDGPRITGSVTFGDPGKNTYSSALPLVTTLEKSIMFAHLASNDTYYTGIAILNPNQAPATVTIDVYSSSGSRDFTTVETIPAMQRTSKLLTQYFPDLAGTNRTSGYIRVTSDQGIASFAVFGTQSALSALPPQVVP